MSNETVQCIEKRNMVKCSDENCFKYKVTSSNLVKCLHHFSFDLSAVFAWMKNMLLLVLGIFAKGCFVTFLNYNEISLFSDKIELHLGYM